MTISQIESFLTLAKYLNFTQAADGLFISQPALSRSISALELELGVHLFKRSTRGVTLTPAGIAFQKESAKVLDAYAASVAKAKLAAQGNLGSIRIGYLRDGFYPHMSDIILAFRELFPDISLEFLALNHSELAKNFEKHMVDVIFGHEDEIHSGHSAILYNAFRDCAVVAKNHRFAQRKSIPIAELMGEPFVVMSRADSQPGHDFVFEACAQAGFTPNVVDQVAFVPALLMLIACGSGVSILSDMFKPQAESRVCFIPLENGRERHQAIIWHTGNANPCMRHLIDVILELTKNAVILSK